MSAQEEWERHLSHGIRLSERHIVRHAFAAIAELEAENQRLRAALGRIDIIVFDVPNTGNPDSAVMDVARIIAETEGVQP